MDTKLETQAPNRFRNNRKAVDIGNAFWEESERNGLAGIVAEFHDGHLRTADGHEFVNFSCCSYLDLDSHPKVIEGAVEALRRYGVLDHCIPRARVQLPALLELEESLTELFGATVVTALSASAAATGLLPLVASGHLSGSTRPLMIFDKNCHVSMNLCRPICADETETRTCRHNDLDYIEDCCRKYRKVCYVCDGSDSLGGYAPVRELLELQSRYGLFLYFDDSHSLSAYGERGQGYIRSHLSEVGEDTLIVATLNKAFGTSGAAVMTGRRSQATLRIIERFAGPLGFSQPMNIPAIGASLASAEIHRTPELAQLQERLQHNIRLFDSLVPTAQGGELFPIRLVGVADSEVVRVGRAVYEAGFYVSPVFFPIVARGTAGLRVMLRAGHTEEEVRKLSAVISNMLGAARPAEVAAAPTAASRGSEL